MPEPMIRATLFVPGKPASLDAWAAKLRRGKIRLVDGALTGNALETPASVEWIANDGEFGQAFSFGTVARDVVEAVDKAPGALVVRLPRDLLEGREAAVAVVEALAAAGALAVRLEESKVGWDVARWLELFSSEDPWAWHRGAVAFLTSKTELQSCGMHAFSLPDVHAVVSRDAEKLQELASILDVYQLAEDPDLRSGHTFAPDPETPRRLLERWPDTRYPPSHSCHNPYGVWRLGPPGARSRKTPELVAVFMPPLRVLLSALEQKAGKPLTRKQVEAARDEGICMTMKGREARELERSRGYADLDPELVWEQWKLVRGKAS